MICNVLYCDAEAYFKVMRHYRHSGKNTRPFCRDVVRYCKNHAGMISDDDVDVSVQVLH